MNVSDKTYENVNLETVIWRPSEEDPTIYYKGGEMAAEVRENNKDIGGGPSQVQ